jgi:hypothetical protein
LKTCAYCSFRVALLLVSWLATRLFVSSIVISLLVRTLFDSVMPILLGCWRINRCFRLLNILWLMLVGVMGRWCSTTSSSL